MRRREFIATCWGAKRRTWPAMAQAAEFSSYRLEQQLQRRITAFAGTPGGGLIASANPSVVVHRGTIAKLAAQHKLPAIYNSRELLTLVAYFPMPPILPTSSVARPVTSTASSKARSRPTAGTSADKYELVINLKTAKASALPCRRRCSPAPTR